MPETQEDESGHVARGMFWGGSNPTVDEIMKDQALKDREGFLAKDYGGIKGTYYIYALFVAFLVYSGYKNK